MSHQDEAPEKLVHDIAAYAVFPGIAEEALELAFLFGLLFRYAGLGFLPAALLAGVGGL